MIKITTVKDKLIVKPIKEESIQRGIIIPSAANYQNIIKAEVIAIGKDIKDINIGDTILLTSDAGIDILVEKVTYKAILEEYILALITELE